MRYELSKLGRVLVIEGASGTGKTTYIQSTVQQRKVVIPELPEFIRGVWTRPGDSDTWDSNLIPMLDGGLIRLEAACRFSQLGYDVVLDRSLLSPLAIVSSLREDSRIDFEGLRSRCLAISDRVPSVAVNMILLDPPLHLWTEWLERHSKAKGYWGSMIAQHRQQEFFRTLWSLAKGSPLEGDDEVLPSGARRLSGDFAQIYQRACVLLDT